MQQQTASGTEVFHPGKRTLTEQVSHPIVQRTPARGGNGAVAPPAARVQLAPKHLVPEPESSPHTSTLLLPDADHPARRDVDGEQLIQTGEIVAPGKPSRLGGKSWTSLAEVAESVQVQDDSGDTLRVDITYRLENRPAEVGEVPDLWIHTERKALLTIGTGEHAGATIVGQARIQLAPGEARDPKAAIGKAGIGASHWAQIYLAEAQQFVNVHGPGGRKSLRADSAENDVLAYDDPLRTLVGLKNVLTQQRVAGHGREVAKLHAQAQRLLVDAERGRAVLQHEIASIASHRDPHHGRVVPVRFLVGDMTEWLAANQRAGRDDTEDARQLRRARAQLENLIADADKMHPPKRNQLDDALGAPARFVERTAEGFAEVGAMAIDAVVLGVDVIGEATGIGTFNYHPISKYGASIESTGSNTTTALVTMINGFADEWSDAIERARHGDYRGLTDVSVDALLMIDGARAGGAVALDKADVLVGKLGNVAKSARAIARSAYTTADAAAADVRNVAAAMADGADAFLARLRAGGMQMATAGGGSGPGPNLGGLSAETFAEAAQAAKEAFKDKRAAKEAPKHAENSTSHPDATKASTDETSYKFVEITDVNGTPIGEFDIVVHDGVATDRFVEDKSARGLKHPKNRQTPTEWARKQIFEKTSTRIKNLEDAVGARPRPDGLGSPSVPALDQLRTIREFEFVIESADPDVQVAVEAQLARLRVQHPGFRFKVRFGR